MSPIRVRTKIQPQIETKEVVENVAADFTKLTRKTMTAKDAILDLGKLNKGSTNFSDISRIERAILDKDYDFLRDVSNYYYDASGIYGRLVRYLATMLTYDWMVTPYINGESKGSDKKIKEDYQSILMMLDNFNLKTTLATVTLEVLKAGVYYGYRRESSTRNVLQQLPTAYCRSRFQINGMPVVEFNVKYFDDQFRDANNRLMVLKSFPPEFQKGYLKMKNGSLERDDDGGYYILLEPEYAVKFNFTGSEMPLLISTIPTILELDKAQELYSKKAEQELLKIIIQKMPLTKDGELIFDIEEAADMHNNAVNMLKKAVGVDVLTTFADTEVQALVDRSSSSAATDPLSIMERSVFNEAGISRQVFATDGNLALEKSVVNDEALMFTLLNAYEVWINFIIEKGYNKNPKKYYFRASFPPISRYNFEKMAKTYKELAQLGYSKMLPAIALGQSQSSILATAHFENEILNLSEVMQPLQMSSTQSGKEEGKSAPAAKKATKAGAEKTGRPEKDNAEKSDKTLANKASQG